MWHSSSKPSSLTRGLLSESGTAVVPGIRALLHAVGDTASGEVVGRELDPYPIARQHADAEAAHLAGQVPQDLVPVVELDPEHEVRKRLGDLAFELDFLLNCH